MTSSLIITTYNRPDALLLCINGILAGTKLPDEIIVADDGSTQETALLIDTIREKSPVPILHVWQADRGFRAARSRNNAAAVASSDYLIIIDGDLMPERHFIADHLRLARKGAYLKGGRCKLTPEFTAELCRAGQLRRLSPLSKGIERKGVNLWHCGWLAGILSPIYRRNKPGVLGCNQSLWRKDYIAINGFDEQYEGWGGEDTDFIRRLRASGVEKRHLKFAGCAAHLWHRENPMQNAESNLQRSRRLGIENELRCTPGVDRAINALSQIDTSGKTIIFPD